MCNHRRYSSVNWKNERFPSKVTERAAISNSFPGSLTDTFATKPWKSACTSTTGCHWLGSFYKGKTETITAVLQSLSKDTRTDPLKSGQHRASRVNSWPRIHGIREGDLHISVFMKKVVVGVCYLTLLKNKNNALSIWPFHVKVKIGRATTLRKKLRYRALRKVNIWHCFHRYGILR